MSDEIDVAQDQEMHARDNYLQHVRRKAAEIPVGVAGECDYCGEWSGRLVDGVCAPCRDRRKLK